MTVVTQMARDFFSQTRKGASVSEDVTSKAVGEAAQRLCQVIGMAAQYFELSVGSKTNSKAPSSENGPSSSGPGA